MQIIWIDPERTDHDNFVIKVQPAMGKHDGATPIFNENGVIVAYKIMPMYE